MVESGPQRVSAEVNMRTMDCELRRGDTVLAKRVRMSEVVPLEAALSRRIGRKDYHA